MIREHHKGVHPYSRKTSANKYKSATPNYSNIIIDPSKALVNPANAKYQSLRIEGASAGANDSVNNGRSAQIK